MNGLPQQSTISGQSSLSSLARLLAAFPVARRGAVLQAAVSFEPARTLDREFAVGPVRAAFAECWETRFGKPVPVRELRAVLAPPVPIKTVLEFSKFNIVSEAEIAQTLGGLLSFLGSEVQRTLPESQSSLFPCTEEDDSRGST